MTEKTTLEKIEEMYDMMQSFQRQLDIIDNNLKLLNSKANGELFAGIKNFNSGELPKITNEAKRDLDAKPTIGVPQPTTQVEPVEQKEEKKKKKRKTTIVQGKILNDEGRPVPGVRVKIIAPTNKKIIAETKTNNAGLWTKFLGPGKYIIKYVHDSRPTQFRMIDVPEGQEKLVV